MIWLCGPTLKKETKNNGKETKKFVTSVRRFLDPIARCDPGLMPLLPSGSVVSGAFGSGRSKEVQRHPSMPCNPNTLRCISCIIVNRVATSSKPRCDPAQKKSTRPLCVVRESAVRNPILDPWPPPHGTIISPTITNLQPPPIV